MTTRILVSTTLKGRVLSQHSSQTDRVFIGRTGDCDITLDNPAVSRCHADISHDGKNYYITDLGSSNGTLLNGQRIQSEILRDGDTVMIGKFELTVCITDLDSREALGLGARDDTIRTPVSRA